MPEIEETLKERGQQYGKFSDGAKVMQSLKEVARNSKGWGDMTASQRESADMILHKLGRIFNGNPDHIDSWHDISGYAQLIEKELKGESI